MSLRRWCNNNKVFCFNSFATAGSRGFRSPRTVYFIMISDVSRPSQRIGSRKILVNTSPDLARYRAAPLCNSRNAPEKANFCSRERANVF